jgi:hypothetical protein
MKGEVVDESVALSGSPCVFGAIVAGIVDCSIAANIRLVFESGVRFGMGCLGGGVLMVMS